MVDPMKDIQDPFIDLVTILAGTVDDEEMSADSSSNLMETLLLGCCGDKEDQTSSKHCTLKLYQGE